MALLGLKCPQLGFSDEKTKGRISMMSGMVFALAGLSSMVALSWYAVNIITEFFDPFYAGTKEHGYRYAASRTVNEPQIYIKQVKTVTPAKDYA
ncbi:Claudin-15, partial [Ophiophagus hannah]